MNKIITWHKNLNSWFLYEKTVICTLLFLLSVLIFDFFFQNLPLSGYGLIFVTLLLIGSTTFATCHGIKWAITSSKPLHLCIDEKSQNEKWIKFLKNYENDLFRKLFKSRKCFESFKHPRSVNEQIKFLLKDIERDFVKSWYLEMTQNPSFLLDSHLILEEIFFKIIKKLKKINCKHLITSLLILYLSHLQEFKRSTKKMIKLNMDDGVTMKTELSDVCKYFHPGSQDQVLDYYLKKITKVILKEFSPVEFSNSLECKILSGIIGRKVIRKFLITLEDPNWINIKLIYLLNPQKHKKLLGGKIYSVKEKITKMEEDREFQFKNSSSFGKRYLSTNIFESSRNLFERNNFNEKSSNKIAEKNSNLPSNAIEKESLTLNLTKERMEGNNGNISTVLSSLISSTAGPLLPDNISVHYKALNKMWQSPVMEVKDISESITNSFRKVFVNGEKEKKGITRSKSTESLTVSSESALRTRDISVGEELCENVSCAGGDAKGSKTLTKTQSFDGDNLFLEGDMKKKGNNSPEKKTSSPELQVEVSPVYEEPEDFATTIAKLRSLLQQRESSSTMSDKSNLSVDSQSGDRSQSSNKSQSLEADSFDFPTACDIPTDGRPFANICISKAELVTESGATHVVYSIQYDGIYILKEEVGSGSEPELVLQTTTVRRRFQDFLRLQTKLEENSNLRSSLKGVKLPSKWLNSSPSGKPEESSSSGRKAMLETFLRQICSKIEIANSSELHEFLAYGQNGTDALEKKDSEPSLQRIDKLLANKVTGVFNSIKTVLPSFDFDSTALIATNDTVKGFQEQKLLQGFLNFGNKPELFEVNVNFIPKDQTSDSLADDIRRYFNRKSDCIDDAVDVLSSNDWLSEQRECRFISSDETCVWENYKEIVFDDDLEPLDSSLPICSLIIDIISELLQDSDSWAVKEPVIRLIKFGFGHWESRLEEEFSKLNWDQIFGNVIRLLRAAVFYSPSGEMAQIEAEETKTVLKELILQLMPSWIKEFVKPEGLRSAISLFVDSFQHSRLNRDVLLRLLDILLVQLLSCHHLIPNST